MIRPLYNRIVVKPDRRPETTESGFIIPQSVHESPPMSGIVIAVGDWPATLRRIYARAIKDAIERASEAFDCTTAPRAVGDFVAGSLGQLLHQAPNPEHHVTVGQRVIFPMEAGHEIVLNEATDEAYVILNEDSILAVYEEKAA